MRQASGQHLTGTGSAGHAPWSLVVDIMLDVCRTGCHLAAVADSGNLATVRSAAEQAGRVAGVPVRVDVSEPLGDDGPPLVVLVRFASPDDPARGHRPGRAAAIGTPAPGTRPPHRTPLTTEREHVLQ